MRPSWRSQSSPSPPGSPTFLLPTPTLINPGRTIPRRPWISPGLTGALLAAAPAPAEVGPELERRVTGHVVVGHNVGVDWRLLHRRYPDIQPVALVDTLRLARTLSLGGKNSLTALADRLGLTPQVAQLAAGSQPHRARWDTIATALLLPALVAMRWPSGTSLREILEAAAVDLAGSRPPASTSVVQDTLFGPA